MTRPDLDSKAAALLTAGRVVVRRAARRRLLADVLGDSGLHVVRLDRGGWSCTCPAGRFNRRCAHVAACQLIADHRETHPIPRR
jgi:hypothetical protein